MYFKLNITIMLNVTKRLMNNLDMVYLTEYCFSFQKRKTMHKEKREEKGKTSENEKKRKIKESKGVAFQLSKKGKIRKTNQN